MTDLDQILEGLIQRTADGKLNWHRIVESNQFTASVETISVVIREIRGTSPFADNYRLEILNETGDTIEVMRSTASSPEQSQQLARLHTLARRSALDVQSTLEKLAKALDV